MSAIQSDPSGTAKKLLGTPRMKRFVIPAAALSSVMALGAMSAAYYRHARPAPAAAAPEAVAASQPADTSPKRTDPFAGGRLAAGRPAMVEEGPRYEAPDQPAEATANEAFDRYRPDAERYADDTSEVIAAEFTEEAGQLAAAEQRPAGRYRRAAPAAEAEADTGTAEAPREFDAGPASEINPLREGAAAVERGSSASEAAEDIPSERAAGDESLATDARPVGIDPTASRPRQRKRPAAPAAAPSIGEGLGRPGERQLDGPQTPSVTIEKIAPAEIQIGKEATFEIRVKNDGGVAASNVEVHDEVPQGTSLVGTDPAAEPGAEGEVVWLLGLLKPGEERTLRMQVAPQAEGEIGSVARVHFSAAASARTIATRPALAVEVTAPREALAGDKLTMSIKVSNPGTGVATGVLIEAAIPEGLEHEAGSQLEYELGDLKPGDSREMDLVLTAAKAGRVTSVLVARGDGNLHVEERAEMEVLAPELTVGLTGQKRRYLEREATYTVSVSNPGTAAAKNVELAAYLPQGLEFVKADNHGEFDAKDRAVRWSLEELPAGETGEVSLTALPTAAGEQKLIIEGSAATGLAAKGEETIMVEGVAAILFEVVDVADPIEIGSETTYEIRVVNQGTKAANELRLIVQLPPDMKFVEAEGPVPYGADETKIEFDSLPQLAPKADTTYRIRVQGLAAGDQRVAVQLITQEMRTPVTEEESTHVLANE